MKFNNQDILQLLITVCLLLFVLSNSVGQEEVNSQRLFLATAIYTGIKHCIGVSQVFTCILRGIGFGGLIVVLNSFCFDLKGLYLLQHGVDVERSRHLFFEEGILVTMIVFPFFQLCKFFPVILAASVSGSCIASFLRLVSRSRIPRK
jgi:hypothetical protein